jgi:hypothetical protein
MRSEPNLPLFCDKLLIITGLKTDILPPTQQISCTASGHVTHIMAFLGHNNSNDNLKCLLQVKRTGLTGV